jgi:ribosomal protein L31E
MAQQLRERMNKWNFTKLKSFCRAKESLDLRDCPQNWRKSSSYSSDKELIFRIYRELKKLNTQRTNNPMKKWAHELKREFSKEEVQMANKINEEVLNFPGHKRNANQNHIKI